jgi:hypothetical protein
MTHVTLTSPELLMAGFTGVFRFVESRVNGRAVGHGLTIKEAAAGDVIGAMAEAAVAKALGRYWLGEFHNHRAMDVPGYQVRHTPYPNGRLAIKESDSDGDRFVLVVGDPPTFYVVGWAWGGAAKQEHYYGQHFGNGGMCYAVPQSDLQPLKELARG